MALPSVGGGYQDSDGNQNEQVIGSQAAPQTATATATLTVTQTLNGLLVVDPTTTASSLTMPTATAIDAVMTNMKTNSTFKLIVINLGTSTGIVTLVVGTGITAVGNLVVGIAGSAAGASNAATFVFRKTGTAAYSVYRVA